ncbi:mCG147731 [Mus musculus]|jgi:hypothetical protein|nr:mCG147731 [Mus musculus]
MIHTGQESKNIFSSTLRMQYQIKRASSQSVLRRLQTSRVADDVKLRDLHDSHLEKDGCPMTSEPQHKPQACLNLLDELEAIILDR